MKPISDHLDEETWQECAGLSPVRAQKEMTKVQKNQPHLLEFMLECTHDLDQEVRELAIYMLYVVCRMFRKGLKKGVKRGW